MATSVSAFRRFVVFSAVLLVAALAGLPGSAAADAATGAIYYPIDRNHSTVGFEAPVLGFSKVTGKFADFAGSVLVHDPEDLTRSEVEITIETASIDTGIEDRDEHLRSEDFFNAEAHPQITFKSKSVERDGNGYRMVGDFTMGGVTKEITIPFRITDHSDTVAAEARLVIDRTEYGVSWMRVMDDGSLFVGKEIDVVIYLLTRVGKPWPLEDEPEAPALQEPDGP